MNSPQYCDPTVLEKKGKEEPTCKRLAYGPTQILQTTENAQVWKLVRQVAHKRLKVFHHVNGNGKDPKHNPAESEFNCTLSPVIQEPKEDPAESDFNCTLSPVVQDLIKNFMKESEQYKVKYKELSERFLELEKHYHLVKDEFLTSNKANTKLIMELRKVCPSLLDLHSPSEPSDNSVLSDDKDESEVCFDGPNPKVEAEFMHDINLQTGTIPRTDLIMKMTILREICNRYVSLQQELLRNTSVSVNEVGPIYRQTYFEIILMFMTSIPYYVHTYVDTEYISWKAL